MVGFILYLTEYCTRKQLCVYNKGIILENSFEMIAHDTWRGIIWFFLERRVEGHNMVIPGEEGEEGLYVVILGAEDGGVRGFNHLLYCIHINQIDSIVHIDISARCSIFNSRPPVILVMSEN